jgi:predicted DCC family thiol-disulfide oxidoreductase YuxK
MTEERVDAQSVATAPVLLFDGVCGFCHGAVQFILRADRRGELRFAALDGTFGHEVVERHPELADVDSVVFVHDPGTASERVTVRSEAALQVVDYLGGPWRALAVAGLIPKGARDRLYDRFAGIRYRVFGRRDTCPIPAPEVRSRFLD